MKALFIVSTLILMLQGCVVMTPQEAQGSRNSWTSNTILHLQVLGLEIQGLQERV